MPVSLIRHVAGFCFGYGKNREGQAAGTVLDSGQEK